MRRVFPRRRVLLFGSIFRLIVAVLLQVLLRLDGWKISVTRWSLRSRLVTPLFSLVRRIFGRRRALLAVRIRLQMIIVWFGRLLINKIKRGREVSCTRTTKSPKNYASVSARVAVSTATSRNVDSVSFIHTSETADAGT